MNSYESEQVSNAVVTLFCNLPMREQDHLITRFVRNLPADSVPWVLEEVRSLMAEHGLDEEDS